MSLFYKISEEDLLQRRNELFIKNGMSILYEQGFIQSSFTGSWFGRNNLGDYTYEFYRLKREQYLELITIHISKGDKWIKIFLNIFLIRPNLNSIEELNGLDGIQFGLMPNSKTEMRLREDDFKGMPLFNFVHHCIGSYKSKSGFEKRLNQLGKLIEKDMNNIDLFIKRWHEMHTPLVTDWEGHVINKK